MISTIVAHDADVSLCVPVFSSYHFYCHHFCCKLCFALRHPGIDCDVFVPIDMILCHVHTFIHLYAGKVGLSLLHVDKYCGHMVKVRRFRACIFDNMSWTYAYTHILLYRYTLYTCKANCVALIAICTLVRGRLWTKDAVLFW